MIEVLGHVRLSWQTLGLGLFIKLRLDVHYIDRAVGLNWVVELRLKPEIFHPGSLTEISLISSPRSLQCPHGDSRLGVGTTVLTMNSPRHSEDIP